MTLYLRIIMINYSFRPFKNLQCASSKSTLSGSLFLSCNTGLDSVVPASWQKAPLCQQRSTQGSCKDKDASLPGSSGCHRPWNMEDCFYAGAGTSPLLPTQVDWLSWATLTDCHPARNFWTSQVVFLRNSELRPPPSSSKFLLQTQAEYLPARPHFWRRSHSLGAEPLLRPTLDQAGAVILHLFLDK